LELELISYIKKQVGASLNTLKPRGLVQGIGDDCAVITTDNSLLLTTDSMVEDVHFCLKWMPAAALGKKAASTSLSDIAAAGGCPKWALLNISAPTGLGKSFWRHFIDGFVSRLTEFDTILIGGDVTGSPGPISVAVTIIAETCKKNYLQRSDIREKDLIFCSGSVGDASAGLYILQNKHSNSPHKRALYRKIRHYLPRFSIKRMISSLIDPVPQVETGQLLASKRLRICAIDLSDGIATDLSHMLEGTGLCAQLFYSKLPISRSLRQLARISNTSPERFALYGGEDYKLLWTAPPEAASDLLTHITGITGQKPAIIGYIKKGSGIWLNKNGQYKQISYKGFEHIF